LEERHWVLHVDVELILSTLAEEDRIVFGILFCDKEEVLDTGLCRPLLEIKDEALALAVPLGLLVLREINILLNNVNKEQHTQN